MNILTKEQVAEALYLEPNYNPALLEGYAVTATSAIKVSTGWDFTKDDTQAADLEAGKIEPLAVECARQYVRQLHFQGAGYNKEHDYALGITALLLQLGGIALCKKAALASSIL